MPPSSIITRSRKRKEMSSGPNNETTAASDSSNHKSSPGVEAEMAPNNEPWRKKVEDDNSFLCQQVAAIQSSMDLLLTRFPQPPTEELFMPRREGPWIVDENSTFVPLVTHSQSLTSSCKQA